jgi:hypothetical protein
MNDPSEFRPPPSNGASAMAILKLRCDEDRDEVGGGGTDILSEEVGDNSVINLGSTLGPNIDLTIEGDGVFAFGGGGPGPTTRL